MIFCTYILTQRAYYSKMLVIDWEILFLNLQEKHPAVSPRIISLSDQASHKKVTPHDMWRWLIMKVVYLIIVLYHFIQFGT